MGRPVTAFMAYFLTHPINNSTTCITVHLIFIYTCALTKSSLKKIAILHRGVSNSKLMAKKIYKWNTSPTIVEGKKELCQGVR